VIERSDDDALPPEIAIDESEDPNDSAADELEASSRQDGTARPVGLVFCTTWTLRGVELDVDDEFEALKAEVLPLEILEGEPILLATFWDGFPGPEKPRLDVVAPSGEHFALILPALKPFFSKQVQMNSLVGFVFRERGEYRFTVSTGTGASSKTLTIM
jgi:hypothetical protein